MSTIEENKVELTSVEIEGGLLLELLEGVSTHAGRDKSLPTLNAVHIEGAGGDLIAKATDRYRLIQGAVRYSDGSLEPSLISLENIKQIITLCKAHKNNLVSITRFNRSISVSSLGNVTTFDLLDGTFPPTEELFSKSEGDPVAIEGVAFNPALMADYAKIAGKGAAIKVYFTGAGKPMRVRITGDKITWRALLMPMRYVD